MTEAEFQTRVLKRLRALGGYWLNTHGGPYQRPGVFDIVGCYRGRYVGIELKRPGKYSNVKQGLSPAQWNVLNQIRANGGTAIVADSEDPIFAELKLIDEEIDNASH